MARSGGFRTTALAVVSTVAVLASVTSCTSSGGGGGSSSAAVTSDYCAAAVPFYAGLPKVVRMLESGGADQVPRLVHELDGLADATAEVTPSDRKDAFDRIRTALAHDAAASRKAKGAKVKAQDLELASDPLATSAQATLADYTATRCHAVLSRPSDTTSAQAKVLVLGDSVALSLATLWQPVDTDGKLSVTGRGFIDCGVLGGERVLSDGSTKPLPDRCAEVPSSWRFWVTEQHPDVVLLVLGAWDVYDLKSPDGVDLSVGSGAWTLEMARNLDDFAAWLGEQGVHLVLMQTPCFLPAPKGTLEDPAKRLDPKRVEDVNAALNLVAERNPDVATTVTLDERFCGTEGKALRPDGSHLSLAGSALAWKQLTPELLAAATH